MSSDDPQAVRHESSAPGALDPEMQARVLGALLRTFVLLTAATAVLGAAVGSTARAVTAALGGLVYAGLWVGLARRGAQRTGQLATLWYFVLAAGAMAVGDGVHDVSMVLFPPGMVMGALLLGRRWRLPLVVVPVATVLAIGLAQLARSGLDRPQTAHELADVVVAAILLLVSGALVFLVVGEVQSILAERRRAETSLRESGRELEQRNESLALVNELAHRLHRTVDVETIAAETVDVLVRRRQPPFVAFFLLEPGGAELRVIADHGFTAEERRIGARLPVDGSLSGLAVRERRIVASDDLGLDERAWAPISEALGRRGARATLCVPLIFGDTVFGTVNLIYPQARAFTPLELDTFQAVGQAVSLALANARHVAGLEHLAFHDPLTGLPNRAAFHRRFAGLAAEAGPGHTGLALLDLSRFREINDALGHQVGDELLVAIGRRLATGPANLDPGREVAIYRFGGDEFAALLPGLEGPIDAEGRVRQLVAPLLAPFAIGGMALEVRASAGFALAPEDGATSHELLRCADIALHRAKQAGGGLVRYARELDGRASDRLMMLSELARAIRDGGLVLHFQPQVALATGAIVGFEALVRWPHPRLGLLGPRDFLPLAETDEIIHPLTYWVVETALVELRRWHATRPGLTMAINLSPRLLLDRNCPQQLEEIIRRVGIDPSLVEFELTETAILSDPESASTMLGRIVAAGARLAIDDFGTGYSSLAYLKRFPVHAIKIDRSFVTDLDGGGQSLAIVRSTVELARSLGLTAIAEGIESAATAEALREMGCDLAQGYHFGSPAPAGDVEGLLAGRT